VPAPTKAPGSKEGRGEAEWLLLLLALDEMLDVSEELTVTLEDGDGVRDELEDVLVE